MQRIETDLNVTRLKSEYGYDCCITKYGAENPICQSIFFHETWMDLDDVMTCYFPGN